MEYVASAAAPTGSGDVESGADAVNALGATLAPVNDRTREQFGLPEGATGVVIADLDQDSALAEQGVRPGDVIERVNDQDVTGPSDVAKAIEQAHEARRDVVVFLIEHEGNDRFVAVQTTQS
jgi:serine protease Do